MDCHRKKINLNEYKNRSRASTSNNISTTANNHFVRPPGRNVEQKIAQNTAKRKERLSKVDRDIFECVSNISNLTLTAFIITK